MKREAIVEQGAEESSEDLVEQIKEKLPNDRR